MRDIERSVALIRLDYEWKEHLRNMDELKIGSSSKLRTKRSFGHLQN